MTQRYNPYCQHRHCSRQHMPSKEECQLATLVRDQCSHCCKRPYLTRQQGHRILDTDKTALSDVCRYESQALLITLRALSLQHRYNCLNVFPRTFQAVMLTTWVQRSDMRHACRALLQLLGTLFISTISMSEADTTMSPLRRSSSIFVSYLHLIGRGEDCPTVPYPTKREPRPLNASANSS